MWEKLRTMKNGVNLPKCPVKLPKSDFPYNLEKAEAFVDMFAVLILGRDRARFSRIFKPCRVKLNSMRSTDRALRKALA